jgi:hypothetical protein
MNVPQFYAIRTLCVLLSIRDKMCCVFVCVTSLKIHVFGDVMPCCLVNRYISKCPVLHMQHVSPYAYWAGDAEHWRQCYRAAVVWCYCMHHSVTSQIYCGCNTVLFYADRNYELLVYLPIPACFLYSIKLVRRVCGHFSPASMLDNLYVLLTMHHSLSV